MGAMTHESSSISFSIPEQSIYAVQHPSDSDLFHERLRQHIEDLRTILQMYHDTLHSLPMLSG